MAKTQLATLLKNENVNKNNKKNKSKQKLSKEMVKIPFKIQIVVVEVLDSSPRNASFNDAQVDDHCMHPRPVFMALSWFKTLKQVTSRRRIFPGRKKDIYLVLYIHMPPKFFSEKSCCHAITMEHNPSKTIEMCQK